LENEIGEKRRAVAQRIRQHYHQHIRGFFQELPGLATKQSHDTSAVRQQTPPKPLVLHHSSKSGLGQNCILFFDAFQLSRIPLMTH
jgi:hypothetical protein